MKSLSLILMAGLVAFGLYTLLVNHNGAGVPMVIIGSLSFLIVSMKTEKPYWYNPKDFMNR